MRKLLLTLLLFVFQWSGLLNAQTCQWAFTAGLAPRSQVTALKKDLNDNIYFSAYTDSGGLRVSTLLEKHDVNQALVWKKQILGDAGISDLEVNALNHAVVIGDFVGAISVDGNVLTSNVGQNSGFIFEVDETGMVLWSHAINPANNYFLPYQLYISNNGVYYITATENGGGGGCSFHKLDASGNIIKSEYTANFDNRTFTNLLTDANDNVYLSGTCGSAAGFDSISANPNFSYQNFLIKYDSTFKAQWFLSRNYITFDDNNRLRTDGQNYFWAIDDFQNNSDTIKIIKVNPNGQVLAEVPGPFPSAFFPSVDFDVDHSGNSVLLINIYTRLYLFHYDPAFNIVWTDTVYSNSSGFPLHSNLVCYDSSFYIGTYYMRDTLMVDNFQLINPNANVNYPSDIFIAKWNINNVVAVSENTDINNAVMVYPNPADDYFVLYNNENVLLKGELTLYDITGKMCYRNIINSNTKTRIPTNNLSNGLFLLKVKDKDSNRTYFRKVVVNH